MGGGGVQSDWDVAGGDDEGEVNVFVVVEVDFLYFDEEEVSLDAFLVEG